MEAKDKARASSRAEAARGLLVLIAAIVPLLVGQQAQFATRQELGDPGELYNVTGLRAPEVGENGAFRWAGANVAIQLQPLGWPLYTTLNVQGVRPEGEPPAQVGAESYGRALGVQVVPRSPTSLEYRLPAASIFSVHPEITLTSTVFQAPGDQRELGLVYYSVDERSGGFPSLPSGWPALWLVLSVILSYLSIRALVWGWNCGWRTRNGNRSLPLMAAVVLGGVIGILNATQRPWLVFYSMFFVVPPLVLLLVAPWLHTLRCHREPPTVGASTSGPAPETVLASGRARVVAGLVTLLVLGLLAWHVVAPAEPAGDDPTHNVSWGVSFYSALPWALQALGVIVVLSAIAWAWFAPVGEPASRSEDDVRATAAGPQTGPPASPVERAWQMVRRNPHYVIPVVGMLIFALVPVAYSEGDSQEFDSRISIGAIWRERELLDFYVKVKLWRWLEPVFRLPSDIYQIVAVVAGGIYLAAAGLLGRTLGRSRADGLVILGALAATGNLLIFFRYVESYALVTAASLFVLWACWRYTEGTLSFGAVGALATLAPFIHGSALWWGPVVAAAWLLRAYRLPSTERWRKALADLRDGVGVGLAIVLVIASVMIIDTYDFERFQVGLTEMGGRDGRTLLPLFTTVSPTEHYAFFSWPHLGAVLQEQLLTAPVALATVLIVLAAMWATVRALAKRTPALVTLGVGAASMLFYSIAWNPDLGPRNDWDLLALPALPLTLLAVYLLLQLPHGKARRLALASYLSLSAVHAAAWVLVHVLGIHY